jgi:hypothetical protein
MTYTRSVSDILDASAPFRVTIESIGPGQVLHPTAYLFSGER